MPHVPNPASLRPAPRATAPPALLAREATGDGPLVSLRLAIARGGIGIELAEPVVFECLRVTELAVAFAGVRFPADVSGGVARFRHRRGELARAGVEFDARALEAWLARRWHGLVSPGKPEVSVVFRSASAGASVTVVGHVGRAGGANGFERAAPVLAFDLVVLADGVDVEVVVGRARGADLPESPMALAMACGARAFAAVGRGATRRGATFVVRSAARALAQAVLPEAGARVPSATDPRWTVFAPHAGVLALHAVRGSVPSGPSEDAVRLREVSDLVRDADELLETDAASARAGYLRALERAPRHPDVVMRIVGIDARAGRVHAALALLADVRAESCVPVGPVAGELLAAVGDLAGAVASLERAADAEESAALAARMFEHAAGHVRDADEAMRLLDRGLARSPCSATARWARLRRRLELGRLDDALADAEHLEALADSPLDKHDLWLAVASLWLAAGAAEGAAGLFERALRYAPDDAASLAGLGEALAKAGRSTQGATALRRALALAEARAEPTGGMHLALARVLAEALDDLPSAIAHVSAIPSQAREACVARGLEGRWRARLGDMAGASLAFARLRDLAGSVDALHAEGAAATVASLLREAATVQRRQAGGLAAAQRCLATALRLQPHDPELRREYREVSLLEGGGPREWAGPERSHAPGERPALELSIEQVDEGQAARVEELTRILHAHPGDDIAARELADLLEALSRSHELVALLFARLEDATGPERMRLIEHARATLDRCAAKADREDRESDLALYRSALAGLDALLA